MKQLTLGMVAHVDAGKTTLSESLLYTTGTIKHQGRVDHKDTFLDYNTQERERGITIFSKVSSLNYKNNHFTFIDTPGHADFSGEMERALSVLDYAIVIINGLDGVQAHTKTIWNLLDHYHVPAFIFVNKMDLTHYTKEELLDSLSQLSPHIMDMSASEEDIAALDEEMIEEYLETGSLKDASIAKATSNRHLYPLYFGSALKNQGVNELLDALDRYTLEKEPQKELSAQVFKITRDERGERLVFIKITGGRLHVRDTIHDEKIHQIRLYQGNHYTLVEEASQNDIVALTGIKKLQAGDYIGLGHVIHSTLRPSMLYSIQPSKEADINHFFSSLKVLGEEEPLLHLKLFDDHAQVSLMGEVQIDILKQLMKDRFNEDITVDEGEVAYLETIKEPIEGVGHFEPLRHYSEVHLYLEPLPQGSGLVFDNQCQNNLEERYQNLIMTHLQEKEHLGVLTGSPITDMKITLLGGKAHLKHTEGGDFREATYRAIRQGLKMTESVILEPYYKYELVIPTESLSKVYYALEDYPTPTVVNENNDITTLHGEAPVLFLTHYQKELLTSTKGKGQLFFLDTFYAPVENQKEVMTQCDYDSESDLDNPTGSIFCSHGAGYYVPYDEVREKMHLPLYSAMKQEHTYTHNPVHISDEELKRVYERTYGPLETKLASDYYKPKQNHVSSNTVQVLDEYLIVDGYNVIFAWDELKELAKENLGSARDKLIDILMSYKGYRGCHMILVFDAYKVPQNKGKSHMYHDMEIVYTKEGQTADAYIESITKQMAGQYRLVVATSDNLEQKIVLGHGATRISSRELLQDVISRSKIQKEEFERKNPQMHSYAFEDLKKS